ncbi:MAG: pantoate--beta-alanine ligase [candidate division Zixibacteria bacterium]|nr:pantoate--beta-alanine ligase [candidate division Zixibacteria bacterium]
MKIIRSIKSMQRHVRRIAAEGKTIGLVPTMGFLHEGHTSLIRRVASKTDVVIVTIFVNPAQFAVGEDLSRYPRDEKRDLRKIRESGGEIVFIPKADDIYPEGYQTFVTVEKLTQTLEGTTRPTHFRGVTTIVAKLFNICRPDVVVFGMKDFQQAVVLRQMTKDLGYTIKFIIAPIIRERDGLAMSSRNAYLVGEHRSEALCLHFALRSARSMVLAGITSVARIKKEMKAVIMAACPSAKIDYIAFTEFSTLRPVRKITKGTICSLAVNVHGVRLIDNIKLP